MASRINGERMMASIVQSFFEKLFGRWADKPQDQQYYVKMFFAIISAVICALGGTVFAGIRGILFGLLMYVLTLYVLIYIMKIDIEGVGGRQKLVTNTLFSYILLWVLLWTLFYSFTLPQEILTTLPNLANTTSTLP